MLTYLEGFMPLGNLGVGDWWPWNRLGGALQKKINFQNPRFIRRFSGSIGSFFTIAALSLPLPLHALETGFSAPGAPDELAEALENSSAALSAEETGLTSPQEILAAALADYRTMVQILYDRGYFSPEVSIRVDGREAADIPRVTVPKSINRVEIRVRTGPEFRFGRARVAPLAPETELPEDFAPGKPAGTGIIREATFEGRDGWRDIGYAKTEIGNQSIVANHQRSTLDADIQLIPGPKLRFGRLSVRGNQRMRAEAIQRIAGLPWDETYSPETVRKVGDRLRRTGTFKSVQIIEDETPNPDGTLDFTAEVTEQPLRRISLGGEIQSTTGVDLSATWIHRNLFGAAERLRLEAEIRNIGGDEEIDGRLGFRLDNPARLGPDNNLFYLGSLERFEREHYRLDQFELGVGVRRVFSDELVAEATLLASVGRSNDAYGDDRQFNMIKLPFWAEYDRRDNPTDATRGYYVNGTVTPFAGFGGSTSGIAAKIDGRAYYSLTETGSIVLAGRLQLGSVAGGAPATISPDLLFFSGGSGTVRGQPYESLGIPVGNDVAGGRSFLNASAEVRARVTAKISVVGFFDYGAVDSSSFISSDAYSHSGAGLGVRYDLGGFGPIRLDLALPVDGPTDDGLQFYIGIGQAF